MKNTFYLWIDKNKMRKIYFHEAREEIASKNISLIRKVSGFALALLLVFMAATPLFFPGWHITWEYIWLAVVLAVFYIVSKIYIRSFKLNYYFVQIMCTLFCATVMAGIIAIDVFPSPNSPASYMPIMEVILPTIFILKFTSLLPILTISNVLYCVAVLQFKNVSVQQNDIFNAIAGLLFGLVVSSIVMELRVNDNDVKVRFQKMSSIDLLTGILNKRTCEENVSEYLKKRDENYTCALMIIDVDNFKNVNDRLGHHYGDELLKGFGSLLTHTFRSSDIIGRIGGDEFMVLLRNVTDDKLYDRKFTQLQTGMKRMGEQLGYSVSFSAGVAVAEIERVSFETLFEMADDALYEAKNFGKNRHVVHRTRDTKLQNKPVILVADNGEMNRYQLNEILGKEYELVEAEEPNEALDLLSQYKDRIKVILLDMHIPSMDGLEILRFINSRESYRKIPVIAITSDENSEEEAEHLGVADMMRKPFELGTVKLRIESVLQ
jgi:diguanylate cyclase (GGDEF)-like protein